MRRVGLLLALAAALAAGAAVATTQRVVGAISQNRISITGGFVGSEIFVYGAIARDRFPEDDADTLGIVVKVIGPAQPVTVRRKRRVNGVWINRESERIDSAPSFYAVAATGPLFETISHTEDIRHAVSLERHLRLVGAQGGADAREEFLEALVRLRREEGLYVQRPGGIELVEDVLFRTSFKLPSNIVEGVYRARVLLTRDREVIDMFEAEIGVRKEGLERLMFDASRQQPFFYALASIAIALGAGLLASEVFRLFRA
ncbi:MAG: hypothetical protein EA355_07275 [Rhodobacteraceae bacterium]|nr:MAG: hypothetical protein EA355_07275 [Paracoccaceae bacterium]